VGRKLLRKVLNEVKNEVIKSIITWSTIFAEQFYKKYGFKRIKEIVLPEDKKEIILIEMKKIYNYSNILYHL
jgi:N-acetylglutamate synthase-like GNAT family acetyltransferase